MDQNGRLLASVLRARSAHSGRFDRRPGWRLALPIVLLVTGSVVAIRLLNASMVAESPAAVDAPRSGANPATASQSTTEVAPADSEQRVPAPTSVSLTLSSRRYVVQSGDTVQSIAQSQGLHSATLASVNDLADPDLLQAGQELLVPATDGLVHVVQPGETLRAIAERYGVDVPAIVSANDLADPDHIATGLRLFVPDARTPEPDQRKSPPATTGP